MDATVIAAVVAAVGAIAAAAIGAGLNWRRSRAPRLQRHRIRNVDVVRPIVSSDEMRASVRKDDIEHISRVSLSIRERLRKLKYGGDCIDAMATTLVELSRNAFDYGCNLPADAVEIRLVANPTTATLWVANPRGAMLPAVNSQGTPILPELPDPSAGSGRGLHLCKELADWLHLINSHDRGIVEAGFFSERVTFEEKEANNRVSVLTVTANSANPSLNQRTEREVDRLLQAGRSVVIECRGTTVDSDHMEARSKPKHDPHVFSSSFTNWLVSKYAYLPAHRVVLVGPSAFRSLFPEVVYAGSVEEAVSAATRAAEGRIKTRGT